MGTFKCSVKSMTVSDVTTTNNRFIQNRAGRAFLELGNKNITKVPLIFLPNYQVESTITVRTPSYDRNRSHDGAELSEM